MISRPDIQLKTIPHGYVGTLATVEHVVDLIKRGAKDFDVSDRSDWEFIPAWRSLREERH